MAVALIGCTPTWSGDVAPIVEQRCASCHQDGTIAPFPLLEHAHAATMANAMAAAAEGRTMPPWLADGSGECGTFRDNEWLSDDEIDTLVDWAAAGAPAGDEGVVVDPPAQVGLTEADVEMDIGADYVPTDADEHRCFPVDVPFDDVRYVTAYEVVPGNPALVHHVIVHALDGDDADAFSAELDAKYEGPGYPCYGNPYAYPNHSIGAWTPGAQPRRFGERVGVRVDGRHKMVIEMHYHQTESEGADRTALRLVTADAVDNEAKYLAFAIRDMQLPPGEPAAVATRSYDLAAMGFPTGFYIQTVFPHMHERGRTFRLSNLHDGDEQCLVDVPRWDFDWQRTYAYAEPPAVARTDTLTLTCTFDTTDDTEPVTWGERTDDEMCLLGLLVTRVP